MNSISESVSLWIRFFFDTFSARKVNLFGVENQRAPELVL